MNTTFYLDFDGVICNSINECFVSSWYAYFENTHDAVSLPHRRVFERLRPYIRRGGDYMVLHYCIDNGIEPEGQEEFDRVLRSLGEEKLDRFHEQFYDARRYLLENDREYWLSLNKLYPGIRSFLEDVRDRTAIITTKEVSFVLEILSFHGVAWEEERVICSGKRRKLDVIHEKLGPSTEDSALLIDDQIDHLIGEKDARIFVYLAEWGYVTAGALESSEVPVIRLEELRSLLR